MRGGARFHREELLSWCERQTVPVDSVVGIAHGIRAIRTFAEVRDRWSREGRGVGTAGFDCARGERANRIGVLAEQVSGEPMGGNPCRVPPPGTGLPSRRSDFRSR